MLLGSEQVSFTAGTATPPIAQIRAHAPRIQMWKMEPKEVTGKSLDQNLPVDICLRGNELRRTSMACRLCLGGSEPPKQRKIEHQHWLQTLRSQAARARTSPGPPTVTGGQPQQVARASQGPFLSEGEVLPKNEDLEMLEQRVAQDGLFALSPAA